MSRKTMAAAPFDLAALEAYLQERHQSAVVIDELRPLGSDSDGPDALKQFGYGSPLLVTYTVGDSQEGRRQEVFHNIKRTPFGRERDDDRVAAVWLDYQTFNTLPRHVRAVDKVGLGQEGQLDSLHHLRDLILVTTYQPGAVYAEDLLALRDGRDLSERDVVRAESLARYLAQIHSQAYEAGDDAQRQMLWQRRLRDLLGHGEGIMGLTDSYPLPLPYVDAQELQALERLANDWRWRLKPLSHRLCQVHGDFHPFNIVFDENGDFTVLDRSRGAWGEAADDVSCLSINYLFFSLQRSGRLAPPFLTLYRRFWETYLEQRPDDGLLDAIAPWFAWRALVVASPVWYPNIDERARRKLLSFARQVMLAERFDWQQAEDMMEETT